MQEVVTLLHYSRLIFLTFMIQCMMLSTGGKYMLRIKICRCLIVLLAIVVTSFLLCIYVNAAAISDSFKVELLDSEPGFTLGFSSFAIGPSGSYAIVSAYTPTQKIAVYNSTGDFIYGYKIQSYGSIAVAWEEDNIAVYSLRGNEKIVIDCNGMVLSQETFDESLYTQIIANTQIVDGETYVAKHWLFNHELFRWGSYNKLVRISSGQEYVLFESPALVHILAGCGIGILIGGIVFIVYFAAIRKKYCWRTNIY